MFNKSCLSDGMIVENREGRRGIIFKNKVLYDKDGYDNLDSFSDNLNIKDTSDFLRCLDIIKVYVVKNSIYNLNDFFDNDFLELIWESTDILKEDNEEIEETIKPKKIYNFNEIELGLLKEIHEVYNWLARDKDGSLGGSVDKPTKSDFFWSETDTEYLEFLNPLFKDIQWEDEDPVYIKDYIEIENDNNY